MDDLNALADEHLAAARASAHGRSAHRLLHEEPLRQTVIALTSGSALDEHNAPAAASLQVLRGRVRLTAASGDVEVSAAWASSRSRRSGTGCWPWRTPWCC